MTSDAGDAFERDVARDLEDPESRTVYEREYWLTQLRAIFEVFDEREGVSIWMHGLKTYGVGDTFEEAKQDLLEEIADALDELKRLEDEQ